MLTWQLWALSRSTSVSSLVEWDAQDLHPWRAGTLRWCYICNPGGCVAAVLTLLILCPQQMLVWRKELQKCRKREREDLTSYLPFFSVVCSLLEKVVFSIISSLSNFFIILFIYGCAESSLLHGLSQVAEAEAGYSAVAVQRLLVVVASLVVELGFSSCDTRAQLPCGIWNLLGPGDRTGVSYIGRQMLNYWATREARKQLLNTEV